MSNTTVDYTKIKPIHDAVFKTIFGTETGKDLLETLLKDILKKDVEIYEVNLNKAKMLQNGVTVEDVVRLTNANKDIVEKIARQLKYGQLKDGC